MGGRIVYTSDVLKDPLTIEQLDATCSLISSEQARMDFLLGFDLKSGGRLDGGFILDTEQAQYGIDARLRRFNLVQLLSYVQEFFDCRTFQGELDVDLAMLDSYRDTTSLAISAGVALRKVAFTDPNNERLFELKSGRARLDTLRAKEQRVEMGAVELDGAALRFVMLADGSDNWTRLMKLDTLSTTADATLTGPHASESNVLMILADYLGYLGRQVVANEYSAERLALLNSTVLFEDHAPSQPLRYALSEINVSVDPVNSVNPIGAITATATLQETGTLNAKATFDPKNIRNVQVDMTVDQLALNHLDPYGRWYAAHPLEDGLMHFVTRTVVTDGRLDSQNHLRVDKLKVGKKVDDHDPEIHVLPLRLAAGLLKDVNGVVELNVPVKGDLKDPKFKVWPIVWQIFKDLLVKAATAPGRLLMRAIQGVDEEDLERVRFNLMQAAPDKTQEKTLRQLAKALKTKPELHVALITLVDHEQEVQEVAIYHAKKEFLFPEKERIDGADSARIEVLSTRDSLFTGYVNGRTANMEGRSLHERCTALVGVATANAVAAEIEAARKEHVMQLLLAEGVPATRAAFREGTAAELAGQRGVPGYRFVYALEE
jgi:hypothetical protein